jgi:hypothetical protein
MLLIIGALALCATSASAEAYRITLANGNEFVSMYPPVPAPFDENMKMVMTSVGNVIALRADEIADVKLDEEVKGYGRRINTTTIEVGWAANDSLTPEQLQAAAEAAAQSGQQLAPVRQPVFNTPLVGEPNSGGGIPLSFANSGSIPMSGSSNN